MYPDANQTFPAISLPRKYVLKLLNGDLIRILIDDPFQNPLIL
jgi:hypothetical protein